MRKKDNQVYYSASDLSGYIHCPRLTALDRLAMNGMLQKPIRESRVLKTLRERGEQFEQAYLKELGEQGKRIVEIDKDSSRAFEETVAAMKAGVDVVYQARLEMNPWQGWSDFLIRVEKPSALGNWSYEVWDTKLATQTKAGTILQIALYSEIIAGIQGEMPECMYIKHPDGVETHRVMDYVAYYRLIKRKFLEAVQQEHVPYPDPVSHCEICNWWSMCEKIRREDDHLSYVAGLGNTQLRELRSQGINKLEELGTLPKPLPFRPSRGAVITYEKLREQARLQLQSRTEQRPVYELLELVPEMGFYNLPEPNKDDIFLDLEGDPLVGRSGREYIFGYCHNNEYYILWAETEEQEKRAFEQFIDVAMECLSRNPAMRIYHFGAYETSAFKRLMLKYATRIDEVEHLLRTATFVDLHQIVRQSLRAGVEKYSLKDLEKYHEYYREEDLRKVGPVKAEYEMLLETDRVHEATPEMREVIRKYNEDDCRSTIALYNWLCSLRDNERAKGIDIPAPEKADKKPHEKETQHQERIKPIFTALLDGLPTDRTEHTPEQEAKYLVAHLLDWYGREKKKAYWDKFRIQSADDEELLNEPVVLYGLEHTGNRRKNRTTMTDEYTYPEQECTLRNDDKLLIHGTNIKATLVSIDHQKRLVWITKPSQHTEVHPIGVFKHNIIEDVEKIERIVQIGAAIAANGMNVPRLQCAIDLLLREKPRVTEQVVGDMESYEKRLEWLLKLNKSVLPMQGPPGTGKTYNASRLIVGLVKAGKKVGVTALSHKVISNLLWSIEEAKEEMDVSVSMLQKPEVNFSGTVPWEIARTADDVQKKLKSAHVIAGTSAMWSHSALEDSVDYLFVDEAGQLSLIDTLVCCYATKNLVLLGDPQQLSQPVVGVHPDGVDVSALRHLFKEEKTIDIEQGIFLGTTWRMHPDICSFNSDLYYDGKLKPKPSLERQQISGNTVFQGAGLFFQSVPHQGNSSYSSEEVEEVVRIFNEMTKGDVYWTDADGNEFVVEPEHIRIITPYNIQRIEISQRLNGFSEVGTVDKFQGQEAPIVIYSMVTSSAEDAPKGMDFLYSPNRFNVAVSRARAVFILVGSPRLFEPECKSPEQMRLANGLCYYMEQVKN